jgi:GNAT superfamily N-acetyltransferase
LTGAGGSAVRVLDPEPQAEVGVHVRSRAELLDSAGFGRWYDPEGIAAVLPGKAHALRTNPLSRDPGEPAQLLGTYGNRVVGRMDVFPGALTVDGEEVPCLHASGLFVSPGYRHLGMGAMLLLRAQQLHHTVVACGISQQALPLYRKLRWRDVPMERYVFVRRSRSVLERYAPARAIAVLGAPPVDAALWAYRQLVRAPLALRLRGLSCDRVDRVPPEVEDLLAAGDERVGFHRSAAWANWILENSFERDPRERRGAYLVRDRRGELVGYFLLTARFHERASSRRLPNLLLGSLQEWLILERNALDAEQLVLLALRELGRWRVAAVEVCLAEADRLPRLRLWGFRRAGDLHLLVRGTGASPLRAAALANPRVWRVRPADGDNAL